MAARAMLDLATAQYVSMGESERDSALPVPVISFLHGTSAAPHGPPFTRDR
jgi:hypothetical protein